MSDRNVGYPFIALYILFWLTAGTALFIFATLNAPPSAPGVGWENAEPTTLSNLNATIARESIDTDGHKVTYAYAWFQNGTLVPDQTEKKLPSELTTKDDVWKVEITPNDGTQDGLLCALPWRTCAGGVKAEEEITVLNSAPKVRLDWAIEDEDEYTHRMYLEVVATVNDSDDDEVTFTYAWFEGEEEPEEEWEPTYTEAILPTSATRRGQTWTVIVTPNDGTDDGNPARSTLTLP